MRVSCFIYGFLLFLFINNKISGEIYDYNAVPESFDTYNTAMFRIYIPENTDTVKGVFHYVKPFNSDSRSVVNDTIYRDLCEKNGFALLGSLLDSRDFNGGIGDALLDALDNFSSVSDHLELRNTTIFFNGTSWGGQWAYDFALWKPEKVIGLITHKGGYHTEGYAGKTVDVPVYMFIGENDLDYRITNLTSIFNTNRPYGAPWILAMEPNTGHSSVKDTFLLFTYFRTITALRLPDKIPVNDQVVLNKIDLTKGWLGDIPTTEIDTFPYFSHETASACWFPDKKNALIWKNFVNGDPTDSIFTFLNKYEISTDDFTIYPNPAQTNLTIHSDIKDNLIWNIINLNGLSLMTGNIDNGVTRINLSGLSNGYYILVIKNQYVNNFKSIFIIQH